jgi:hypothetical protein
MGGCGVISRCVIQLSGEVRLFGTHQVTASHCDGQKWEQRAAEQA